MGRSWMTSSIEKLMKNDIKQEDFELGLDDLVGAVDQERYVSLLLLFRYHKLDIYA